MFKVAKHNEFTKHNLTWDYQTVKFLLTTFVFIFCYYPEISLVYLSLC